MLSLKVEWYPVKKERLPNVIDILKNLQQAERRKKSEIFEQLPFLTTWK